MIGIIAGYLVAYLYAGTGNWRAMLGLAAVPAVLVTCMLTRIPDTARWYLLKGRVEDAERTLRRIEPGADARRELAEISRTLRAEQSGGLGVLREMLRPPYLRATLFVVTLGFFIQITGINAIVYYSPRLFEKMGFHGDFALLILPALIQVAALAAMIVSLTIIDRVGGDRSCCRGSPPWSPRTWCWSRCSPPARRSARPPRRSSSAGAAVHRRLHLRIRFAGLGLRRGKPAGANAVAGILGDADLRPGGQCDGRRRVLTMLNALGSRDLRGLRRVGATEPDIRLPLRPGDQRPPARRHPAFLGERRTVAAGAARRPPRRGQAPA